MASSVWIDLFGPVTYDGTTIIFPGNVQAERFLGADGTAAAPTFSFYGTGDGDNGMYLSAADTLGFSAGGTLRLSVSASAVTSSVPILLENAASTLGWSDIKLQRAGTSRVLITTGVTDYLDIDGPSLTATLNSTFSLKFGSDVSLSRGAANRLDLATGDSFNVVSGNYMHAGVAGFTGTGSYTNFTIAGGIITAAS